MINIPIRNVWGPFHCLEIKLWKKAFSSWFRDDKPWKWLERVNSWRISDMFWWLVDVSEIPWLFPRIPWLFPGKFLLFRRIPRLFPIFQNPENPRLHPLTSSVDGTEAYLQSEVALILMEGPKFFDSLNWNFSSANRHSVESYERLARLMVHFSEPKSIHRLLWAYV